MSSPDEDDVFMKLAEEDGKILELENVHEDEDYEKTLEITERRFSLFREYAAQSTDPVVTEIILTQAQLNKLEMGLLNARHELQTDIAKLTSRIDESRIETNFSVSNLYFWKYSAQKKLTFLKSVKHTQKQLRSKQIKSHYK